MVAESIILSPEFEKIEMNIANSLFTVSPELRSEIEKSVAPLVFLRLKDRKQMLKSD